MERSMIVVGAGIAGLSTACYAQLNGYRTTILEAHSIPGGLCTAWKRKGYTFDISMHMLVGSRGGAAHRMWQELALMDGTEFHYHETAMRIESGGKTLTVTTDARRLEEDLIALSPEDAERSRDFVRLYYGRSMMGAMSLTPSKLMGLGERIRMMANVLPLIGTFRKYGNMTIQEFAAGFKDPFLQHAIRFFIDSPGWPMQRFPMAIMAGMMNSGIREAGVPLGGSQQAVNKIAGLCEKLGCRFRYKTRVAGLLIENDHAVGVRLENGEELRADEIVWAADGHTVIFDMLGGRFVSEEIRDMYESWIPVQPVVHVMIGVDRDFSAEPHSVIFRTEKPISVGGEEKEWLNVIHHSFDKTMAPAGRSAVEVWYATGWDYWKDLAADPQRYQAEKKRIADETIAALERRWPGFASKVEFVDVPTPATYVRYTGNWKASPDGWYVTPENMMKQEPVRGLPGLGNFHMAGQWTTPFAGTVMSAITGRQLIQLLCRKERRKFRTAAERSAV